MNVVYIHTHDTGRYIQPYGYGVSTPRLMEFARDAALFRHCYNAGPTCSPSRAALLTGMSPHVCGMEGLAHRGWKLNDYGKHMANYLKQNGFYTALCGVQHEAPSDEMIGYSQVLPSEPSDPANPISRDEKNAATCAAFIKDYFGKDDGKPLFLSFGMFSTHRVYPKLNEGDTSFDYAMPPTPMYDCEQNRRDMAEFMQSASIADSSFGTVVDALKQAGVYDDTLIYYTTDHGLAFPRMKCTLYDAGIGVSLIMRLPGGKLNGRATDALVSHLDVFPTVCEAAGVTAPDWLEGYSLMPVLNGETEKVREEINSEVTYHAAYEPMRCIRTDRYKLIRFFDDHNAPVLANTDAGHAKSFLIENGCYSGVRPREMLFDIYADPAERENLVADSRYSEVYSDLWMRLESWMKRTGDPLLTHGSRVPKPQGARVNKRSSVNPGESVFEE